MIHPRIPAAQPVRVGVLIAVVAALGGALALNWKVLFASRTVSSVTSMTGGLVQPTLVAAGVTAALVAGVLVASGVPLGELGLRRRDLPRALALLIVLYAALQLAILVAALVSGSGLVVVQDASTAVGVFASQLFGNALVEEAVFRGFLFRQLLARARLRGGTGAIVAATALAAAIFALWHIPVRLATGYHGADLIATLVVAWLGGVLVSYLYVRSGNLLILVVLHTLFNDQASIVRSPVPSQWILCVLAIGVIAWIEVTARRRSPGRNQPVERSH
jgi:membrane protease YdiL (CAAX protease family)